MDYLKQFVIPFSGLAVGNHQFEFVIGDKFFERIDFSEIDHGDIQVLVDLDRQERMLVFDIRMDGKVIVDCDRCLDPLELIIQKNEKLFVKFGEEYLEESDDVIVIKETDYQFNLAQYLYEFIVLSLPYQRVHPDDKDGKSTCNPEILSKLEALRPPPSTDPIWDDLRNITLDN